MLEVASVGDFAHAPGLLTLPHMKDPLFGLFLRLWVPTTLCAVLGLTVQMQTIDLKVIMHKLNNFLICITVKISICSRLSLSLSQPNLNLNLTRVGSDKVIS